MARHPVGPALSSYASAILHTHRPNHDIPAEVQGRATRIHHLHPDTLPSGTGVGSWVNAKTGKRARGSRSTLLPDSADTLREGYRQDGRCAVAPLAGALRIPGHTLPRAPTHHFVADLWTSASPDCDAVSSLLVVAEGGGG